MFTFNDSGDFGHSWIPFDNSRNLSHGRLSFNYPGDLCDRRLTLNHTGNLRNGWGALNNTVSRDDSGCIRKHSTRQTKKSSCSTEQQSTVALSCVMSFTGVSYLWLLLEEKGEFWLSDFKKTKSFKKHKKETGIKAIFNIHTPYQRNLLISVSRNKLQRKENKNSPM